MIQMKKKIRPHFFTVFFNSALQLHKLRLPKKFVKDHGKHLPDCINLQAPNGIDWLVEIFKCNNGETWLQAGWNKFAEHYSITSGHVLVFRYERSITRFHVLIFESSTALEINYPQNNLHQEIQHKTGEEDRVLQRAEGFQRRNPNSFILNISKRNLSYNSGPVFPTSHCRTYFKENVRNTNVVFHINKNTWCINLRFDKSRSFYGSLKSGWKEFVLKNELRKGDKCVLELIDSTSKIYNVQIFRFSKKTDDNHTEMSGGSGKCLYVPNVVKANAFVGDGPGFILNMNKSYADLKYTVHVPLCHSKRYLMDEGDDCNVITVHGKDGRTWNLKYHFVGSSSFPNLSFDTWSEFRSDNHLEIGDICAFKLINRTEKAYNVAIFRVNGNEP